MGPLLAQEDPSRDPGRGRTISVETDKNEQNQKPTPLLAQNWGKVP
jgi:hypothetical protein